MKGITRVGDTTEGVCNPGRKCCPHGRNGTNQTGSHNVFVEGAPVHRLGDSGSANCPHGGTFISVEGSGTVRVNGQPITRVGDKTTCLKCGKDGVHKTGASRVFIGD